MEVKIATDQLVLLPIASSVSIAIALVAVQATPDQSSTSKIAIATIAVASNTAIVPARNNKGEGAAKIK